VLYYLINAVLSTTISELFGNGKRHRTPRLKEYELKSLVILGEVRYQQLKALIKEPIQKIKLVEKRKKSSLPIRPAQFLAPAVALPSNPANLNTESKARIYPAWPQDDDHCWHDLNQEEQRTLHHLLKGKL